MKYIIKRYPLSYIIDDKPEQQNDKYSFEINCSFVKFKI